MTETVQARFGALLAVFSNMLRVILDGLRTGRRKA